MNLGDKVRIWPRRVDKKKKWLRINQYRKTRTLVDLSAIAILPKIIKVPRARFQEETWCGTLSRMIGSLQKSIKFDALLFLLGYSWLIVVGCSILVSRFSGPCFEVVRYPASKKFWRQLQLWGGCRTHHGIKAAIQNPGPSVEVGLAIASWHQGKASHAAGDRIDMDPGVVYSVITLLVRNPTIIRNITKIRKNNRNRGKNGEKKNAKLLPRKERSLMPSQSDPSGIHTAVGRESKTSSEGGGANQCQSSRVQIQ